VANSPSPPNNPSVSESTNSVLFVCLGNICRSPLAEGLFLHLARERQVDHHFEVDSCGTGHWHVGSRPDGRALAVARKHGVELPSVARQIDPDTDFDRFALIIPMDRQNLGDILRAGADEQRVRLLRSFDPAMKAKPEGALDVPDPYFGGPDGFDEVFTMIRAACLGMLDHFGLRT